MRILETKCSRSIDFLSPNKFTNVYYSFTIMLQKLWWHYYYYYLLLWLDSYTEEEIELDWSDEDPVQTNENLTLPQFVLLAVDTHRCHMSYITGRSIMEVAVSWPFESVHSMDKPPLWTLHLNLHIKTFFWKVTPILTLC